LRELLDTPLRIRTRADLQKSLWPDQAYLDFDSGLNKVIHSLRRALGDEGKSSRYIQTVAAGGYRFAPESLRADAMAAANTSHQLSSCSIAVLPITVSGTCQGASFRGGRLTSELTDALSLIPGLRVMAQCLVKSHYTPGASPLCAGDRMRVRAVLWGNLILRESTLFLRMELVDMTDGAQLSAISLEKQFASGLQLENEIGEEILRQLRPVLISLLESRDLVNSN
jgi:TolB-like protein